MKDERIVTTFNRFAAGGFLIWQLLLSISLCYRTLILKQHPREWWDILAIFCFGIFFVSAACAKKGIFFPLSKRGWLALCIGLLALAFITGKIHSVVDVGGLVIGILLGMGLLIGITHFLDRRWKRKEGFEDEKEY